MSYYLWKAQPNMEASQEFGSLPVRLRSGMRHNLKLILYLGSRVANTPGLETLSTDRYHGATGLEAMPNVRVFGLGSC